MAGRWRARCFCGVGGGDGGDERAGRGVGVAWRRGGADGDGRAYGGAIVSALCEALVALGLTFGVLCQPDEGARVELPADDPAAWAIEPPAPEPGPEPAPATEPPAFPVVVVHEPTAALKPEPAAAPEPVIVLVEEPRDLSPYRAALEAALSAGAMNPGAVAAVEASPEASADKADASVIAGLPALDTSETAALPPALTQPRYAAPGRVSGLPVDNTRILTADRYISGVLETGFNSQVASEGGGAAIIQTSRDVFGYHGRKVLIPKGSRLICGYEGPERQGETRVAFRCERILIAGHRAEIWELSAPVGDAQGRGGVAGEVDNRFFERYGTAFLLAGVSAAVRLGAAAATPDADSATGRVTDEGAEELSERFGEITAAVLEQTIDLAPIITLAQGTRVQIRPARDWYIARPGEARVAAAPAVAESEAAEGEQP